MSLATLVRAYRGFSEMIAQETHAMSGRADGGGKEVDVKELEFLIDEEKHQADAIRHLWEKVEDRAREAEYQDYQGIGDEFRGLFEAALASLQSLSEWSARMQQSAGKSARNADVLQTTIREVREMRENIMGVLDWLNRPMEEPGPEFFNELEKLEAEGGFIDVQDIIRELQGNGPPNGSPADR